MEAATEFVFWRLTSQSQLNPKLHGKIVEILRNYVKISLLRGVRLAFRGPFKWTWNEGRSEAKRHNRSSPADQGPRYAVAACSRFWDTPLNMHNIKQFQLLRLVLPLRFRQ